ncbi:MAG: thioesterase family protein [Verrucomicrobiota bacterium]|nr:thioesterase family protein [Verrucomicrobiota bacterium]
MEALEYSFEVEVMFYDTDVGGVVHNIAYLRFIEYARTKLAVQLGMKFEKMAEQSEFPVVVRTEIDYLKPAKLGDTLVVTSRLVSMERVRFYIDTVITRKNESAKLIQCHQTLAIVRMPQGKVLPAPASWRECIPPTETGKAG